MGADSAMRSNQCARQGGDEELRYCTLIYRLFAICSNARLRLPGQPYTSASPFNAAEVPKIS